MLPVILRRFLIDFIEKEIQREQIKQEARKIVGRFLKSLRVHVDVGGAQNYLAGVQRQVRYATAVALTKTAKETQNLLEKEIANVFDRPTPFTKRAVYINSATRDRLEAMVGIKDKQAEYLLPNIVGGRRQMKRFEQGLGRDAVGGAGYWVPGEGVSLNAYGNISRLQLQKIFTILKRSGKYEEVFIGAPFGGESGYGIWARPKRGKSQRSGGIKPLLIRVENPTYNRRFDFYGIVQREAPVIFKRHFDREFSAALRR